MESVCDVTDSLAMARHKHPGQSNTLDALCRRYGVDNSARTLHGALLDAEILADVFLLMTGGQTALFGAEVADSNEQAAAAFDRRQVERPTLPVVMATVSEQAAHAALLERLEETNGSPALWRSD